MLVLNLTVNDSFVHMFDLRNVFDLVIFKQNAIIGSSIDVP